MQRGERLAAFDNIPLLDSLLTSVVLLGTSTTAVRARVISLSWMLIETVFNSIDSRMAWIDVLCSSDGDKSDNALETASNPMHELLVPKKLASPTEWSILCMDDFPDFGGISWQ